MLRTVIIDDEEKITRLIKSLLEEYCPAVEVIGMANSVLDGIKLVQNEKPDLVFLDIEMPHGSGFDLIEAVPDRTFDVVFITAYNQYAIKAFKVNATDYILKPVDIDELTSAVGKVEKLRSNRGNTAPDYSSLLNTLKPATPKVAVPSSEGTIYIRLDEIIYIEADSSYSQVFKTDRTKMVVSKNIKKFEEQLHQKGFLRVHKSFIVNLECVKKFYPQKYGAEVEMTNGAIIPVSRKHKEAFLTKMNTMLE